jgi:hypothetical protein
MENVRTIDPERGERDTICSRCGAPAEWIFTDSDHTRAHQLGTTLDWVILYQDGESGRTNAR